MPTSPSLFLLPLLSVVCSDLINLLTSHIILNNWDKMFCHIGKGTKRACCLALFFVLGKYQLDCSTFIVLNSEGFSAHVPAVALG